MHLIKGNPAAFYCEQICYGNHGLLIPDHLCESLYELRQQQKKSNEWRHAQGWDSTDFSYLRVRVEVN